MELSCLFDIEPGQTAIVTDLQAAGSMRRRLMDLGLTPGTRVECLGRSPFGDPAAFLIRGAVIALRKKDCRDVLIQDAVTADQQGESGFKEG
ncbi:MAG: ferrous iron transport protein A [Eubacterium sp.]|nr:ferrous iron transport protein A [Eubacterium sp.]